MATTEGEESSVIDRPLTLRLRCWHLDAIGENKARNDSLAARFQHLNLQHWTVEGVTPSVGNTKANDELVPVSVDFCHESLFLKHHRAAEYTRELWATYIEQVVLKFFESQGKALVVFALYVPYDDLEPAFRVNFSLHRWNQTNTYSRPRGRLGASRVRNAGEGPSTGKYLELAGKLGYCLWNALPDNATNGARTVPANASQPKKTIESTEKWEVNLKELSDIWESAKILVKEHVNHQSELTNDININNQRFSSAYQRFQNGDRAIMASLESILTPEVASNESTMHLNAESLERMANAMREMMKITEILHEKVICLLDAVKDKHESWIKPKKWIIGGAVAICYAGFYYFFPGWFIYSWVTAGGWSKTALYVGGLGGGAVSGGWGAWRQHKENTATDQRQKVNDLFNGVSRQLKKLFTVVAVCYCEAVLRSPFQELSNAKQLEFLENFGIDIQDIGKEDWANEKLEQVKEGLEQSQRDFVEALTQFRKAEGLEPMMQND